MTCGSDWPRHSRTVKNSPEETAMTSTTPMRALLGSVAMIALMAGIAAPATADETCQSPYMAKITGHEEYVYVWTLGVDGVGDESERLRPEASAMLSRSETIASKERSETSQSDRPFALSSWRTRQLCSDSPATQ